MLTNRISHIQRFSRIIRKYSSHVHPTYPFAKLRAYPFRISPEDAIVQMAPYASCICLYQEIYGSLAARFLPGFGFKPLQPVRITPVYFPGWYIDAEVSANFNLGNVPGMAYGVTQASYLPGSDFRVLSWVSYRLDRGPCPVPFTEELTNQHGVDVTCIPYTISPFAGFDLAQSATDPIQLHEDMSFVPSSIRAGMFAAYPVLFPLYLAQYEYSFRGKNRRVTLFIEAATSSGRIRSEKLDLSDLFPTWVPPQILEFTHALESIDVHCLRGSPSDFFRFDLLGRKPIASTVDRWLNNAVVTHGVRQILVKKSGLLTSDDDPRIRPFTVEERKAVDRWLALNQEIMSLRRVLDALETTLKSTQPQDSAGRQDTRDNTIKSLERKIVELMAEREVVTPQWWREWQDKSQISQ